MNANRRWLDLVGALAIHVAALPFWFIQAFLWDFPGQTPEEARRTEIFILVYGGTLGLAYVSLVVAIVVWWWQGRTHVYLSPLVAAGITWCPCLLVFVIVPAVRRALIPRRPA